MKKIDRLNTGDILVFPNGKATITHIREVPAFKYRLVQLDDRQGKEYSEQSILGLVKDEYLTILKNERIF